MYESSFGFPTNVFAEFDRLQNLLGSWSLSNSIRAGNQSAFPAVNMGTTPNSIEVYAFAPGINPDNIQVNIDRGLLSISGERVQEAVDGNGQDRGELQQEQRQERNVYASERFKGTFKRAISLPKDADANNVEAHYQDGILHITVARLESAQPKQIQIK